jgi:polyhydroxyalkanoate synthesis regulator phasin
VANSKDKSEGPGRGRADAVRSAVDQAFQATAGQAANASSAAAGARERVQELADELAQAAGKVREALDDLRPPSAEELRQLQRDVRALEERVTALEKRD